MKRLIAPALAAVLLLPLAGSAQTSVTANAGWSSNYFYRGVPQKSSSASAGLDVEGANGLSIGVWGADVGEGNEVDFYGGYGLDIGGVEDLRHQLRLLRTLPLEGRLVAVTV